MPCVLFSISRPMTSGINFPTNCDNVHVLASRWMISVIFFLMARICDDAAYVVFLIWFGLFLVNAMAKIRRRLSSVVLTVTLASINDCHFRTSDLSLSEVKSRPWKLVRQFLPWTSSTLSLTFLNEWSSSFWRSARETSKIRPLRASLAFLRPVVRFTSVFPTLKESVVVCCWWWAAYSLVANVDGAFKLYQSFLANGSCVLFLRPFLPFDNLLFLRKVRHLSMIYWGMAYFPTAMIATKIKSQVAGSCRWRYQWFKGLVVDRRRDCGLSFEILAKAWNSRDGLQYISKIESNFVECWVISPWNSSSNQHIHGDHHPCFTVPSRPARH